MLVSRQRKRFWEAAGVAGSSGWVISSHSERSGPRDMLQRADEGTGCLKSRKIFHWDPWPVLQAPRRGLSFKSGSVWTSASHAHWGQLVAPRIWGLWSQPKELILSDGKWCDKFFHAKNHILSIFVSLSSLPRPWQVHAFPSYSTYSTNIQVLLSVENASVSRTPVCMSQKILYCQPIFPILGK